MKKAKYGLIIVGCLVAIAGGALAASEFILPALNKSNSAVRKESKPELFRIIENNRLGYINKQGETVIPPQFDFSVSLMDTSTEDYISNLYTQNGDDRYAHNGFAEGLLPVRLGDRTGYVDRKGSYVINPQFDERPTACEAGKVMRSMTMAHPCRSA